MAWFAFRPQADFGQNSEPGEICNCLSLWDYTGLDWNMQRKMNSYVLDGSSWPVSPVTWSFSGSAAFAGEVREAFAAWDRVIALDFMEAPAESADIFVDFAYIDGHLSTLAHASTSYLLGSKEIFSSEIVFDSSESWVWSDSEGGGHRLADGASFYTVALHEIGHAIGLEHASDPDVIMYHQANGNATDLTYWDIYGARSIYGPETSKSIVGQTREFEPLSYIASYPDLIRAFGADAAAGTAHFQQLGQFEGRTVSFDGLEYIASYRDLIHAFGANSDAGAIHYIRHGEKEGRSTTFDGFEYIASYSDLLIAFGADSDAGATHYIRLGIHETRARDLFDAEQYLANYADLRAAFGRDLELATLHYIENGFYEGRADEFLF